LRAGIESPGSLDVTTRFTGALADGVRTALERGNPEQRQRDYEAYIAQYYPGARSLGPIRVNDDRNRNTLEVRERYRLESSFTANQDGVLELVLHADELYSYLEPLGAGGRQVPLALEYPIRIRQTLEVLLPDEWNVTPENVAVDNPAFRYRGAIDYAARTLTMTYDYEALEDHVEPQAIARFEADRARAYDDVGYVLTFDKTLAASGDLAVAPLPALAVLLSLGLSIWGAVRYGYRYDPEPRKSVDTAPVGIAGWLILPMLGVILAPFLFGYVALVWAETSVAGVWQAMPSLVDEQQRGSVHYVAAFVIASSVAFFVASILNAVLFFARRTSAPLVFIVTSWLGSAWAFGVALWGMSSGLDTDTTPEWLGAQTMRDVLATLIWTGYMLWSRRVAATFVRRWQPRAPASV
jgi:uncharacterized protein DUF2569